MRYQLVNDVERFSEDVIVRAGAKGTLDDDGHGTLSLKLDEPIEELEDWDNCLIFYGEEGAQEFAECCAPIGGAEITAGEWEFADEYVRADGEIVADVYTRATKDTLPGEMEANGKAIAATPKMLAILQEFCADVESAGGPASIESDWPDLCVTYRKARALLDDL